MKVTIKTRCTECPFARDCEGHDQESTADCYTTVQVADEQDVQVDGAGYYLGHW